MLIDGLEERIQNINYKTTMMTEDCGVATIRRNIIHEIIQYGREKGFRAEPEVHISSDSSRRIHVVWFDDNGRKRYGFQVVGSATTKRDEAIKKLKKCQRKGFFKDNMFNGVIVTKNKTKRNLKETEKLLDTMDITHIDAEVYKN